MSKLVIKSTEKFRKANKKTSAVALEPNCPDLSVNIDPVKRENPLVNGQKIIDALYGDIPDKYRFKEQEETEKDTFVYIL